MTFKRRDFTPAEDNEIVRLKRGGTSNLAIAQILGRGVKSIDQRIWSLRKAGRLQPFSPKRMSQEQAFTLAPPLTLKDDDALVRLCLAEGGFPRALVHDGRTFWVDASNRPWVHGGSVNGRTRRAGSRRLAA